MKTYPEAPASGNNFYTACSWSYRVHMALRCDDCIRYHLSTCHEIGVSREEVFEVFSIANLLGGSICIPHTRRALEYWDELENVS